MIKTAKMQGNMMVSARREGVLAGSREDLGKEPGSVWGCCPR